MPGPLFSLCPLPLPGLSPAAGGRSATGGPFRSALGGGAGACVPAVTGFLEELLKRGLLEIEPAP